MNTTYMADIVPWERESKQLTRERLLTIQRLATNRARACQNTMAQALFWDAVAVAAQRVFVPADESDLRDLADALVRLMLVAGAFERLGVGDEIELRRGG